MAWKYKRELARIVARLRLAATPKNKNAGEEKMYVELFTAILTGDVKTTLELIKLIDLDILYRFDNESSSVANYLAEDARFLPVLEWLRENRPSLLFKLPNKNGRTPFISAVISNQPEVVDFFLKHNLDKFASLAHENAYRGTLTQPLTAEEASAKDSTGNLPLYYAAVLGKKDVFENCLKATPSALIQNQRLINYIVTSHHNHLLPLVVSRLSKREWGDLAKDLLLLVQPEYYGNEAAMQVMFDQIENPAIRWGIKRMWIGVAVRHGHKATSERLMREFRSGEPKARASLLMELSTNLSFLAGQLPQVVIGDHMIENVVAAFHDDLRMSPALLYLLLKDFIKAGNDHDMRYVLDALPAETVQAALSHEDGEENPPLLRVALTQNRIPAFYMLRHHGARNYIIKVYGETAKEVLEKSEKLIDERRKLEAWKSRDYLQQFYSDLISLYRLLEELRKTKKWNAEIGIPLCEKLIKVATDSSLDKYCIAVMQHEFDVCMNELWKIAKQFCKDNAGRQAFSAVLNAICTVQRKDSEVSIHHFVRQAHLEWVVGQYKLALGHYANYTGVVRNLGRKWKPTEACEFLFTHLLLNIADAFQCKLSSEQKEMTEKLWMLSCDGVFVPNIFICLSEPKKINKPALEAVLQAVGKLQIPIKEMEAMPTDMMGSTGTAQNVRMYKMYVKMIFEFLKKIEAILLPDLKGELNVEKILASTNGDRSRMDVLGLFFCFKQRTIFLLQSVMDLLEKKVNLPKMSYAVPAAMISDLEKGFDVIASLLERDPVKEKKEEKAETRAALERERAAAAKEKARLEREKKEAEAKEAQAKKKAEDDARTAAKRKEAALMQAELVKEKARTEAAAAAAALEKERIEREKKEAEEKEEQARKKADDDARLEAAAAAKAEQEKKEVGVLTQNAKNGMTLYAAVDQAKDGAAKLVFHQDQKTIAEVIPFKTPAVFATRPEKILEVLYHIADGWKVDAVLANNLVEFRDSLHQIDVIKLKEKTRQLFEKFPADMLRIFKSFHIDEVAVMKSEVLPKMNGSTASLVK
jgi:ankyrin repeat protein